MKLVYLACPVRPIWGETKASNLERARQIYKALSLAFLDTVFMVPWILNCEVFDETAENIDKGMERNYRVIEVCSELWLAGPRVQGNMIKEAAFALDRGLVLKRVEFQGDVVTYSQWQP